MRNRKIHSYISELTTQADLTAGRGKGNDMVSTYAVYFERTDMDTGNDERYTDYVQALNAQQAADYAREFWGAVRIIEIAKVIKNWK